jgi:hypothetical protein
LHVIFIMQPVAQMVSCKCQAAHEATGKYLQHLKEGGIVPFEAGFESLSFAAVRDAAASLGKAIFQQGYNQYYCPPVYIMPIFCRADFCAAADIAYLPMYRGKTLLPTVRSVARINASFIQPHLLDFVV